MSITNIVPISIILSAVLAYTVIAIILLLSIFGFCGSSMKMILIVSCLIAIIYHIVSKPFYSAFKAFKNIPLDWPISLQNSNRKYCIYIMTLNISLFISLLLLLLLSFICSFSVGNFIFGNYLIIGITWSLAFILLKIGFLIGVILENELLKKYNFLTFIFSVIITVSGFIIIFLNKFWEYFIIPQKIPGTNGMNAFILFVPFFVSVGIVLFKIFRPHYIEEGK